MWQFAVKTLAYHTPPSKYLNTDSLFLLLVLLFIRCIQIQRLFSTIFLAWNFEIFAVNIKCTVYSWHVNVMNLRRNLIYFFFGFFGMDIACLNYLQFFTFRWFNFSKSLTIEEMIMIGANVYCSKILPGLWLLHYLLEWFEAQQCLIRVKCVFSRANKF